MKYFQDMNVLITGAASGMGKMLAIEIAFQGAVVHLWDKNEKGLKQVVKEIKEGQGIAVPYTCDLSNKKQINNCAKLLKNKVAAPDIIINNAGIVTGKKILESHDREVETTININLMAPIQIIREFLPAMINNDNGHIVNISSAGGLIGVAGLGDYSASKFALFGFDESLRVELKNKKSNVKTTIVCPYYVNTGMFDGVKTRVPFLLPILKPEKVVNKILKAIKKQKPRVIMPWFVYSVMLCRILPVGLFDFLAKLFGIHDSMNEFKGKN